MDKKKTLSSFIWRVMERFGAQAVSLLVSIVLARLLDPEMYGKISLITVFYTILQVFVDSGLGNALIQKKNADDLDFSSVFYFNLCVCLVLYIGIFLCAPIISTFYADDSLTPLIRTLSIAVLISGVANIQQAYVSRNMLFKRFFISSIIGTLCSGIVGIVLAYLGFGVWALVIQRVVNMGLNAIILWSIVPWRPHMVFSITRLGGLISYGWKLLASTLLDTVHKNIRSLVIGKIYTEEDLAFYNQGVQYPNLLANNVTTAIDSVLLPTMSQEQDDLIRVKAMMRRAIKISCYVMSPLMIGLAACAKPIITLLLTDKWIECVPYMQVFSITYLFYPIHTSNLNAIKAVGRTDLFLKLEIAKKGVALVILAVTMFISVKAMAYSLLLETILCTVINAIPNKKLLNYRWIDQMKDILPSIGIASAMGVIVSVIGLIPLPEIVTLLLQVISGILAYVGLSIIFKVEEFDYLLAIIKSFLAREKGND